MRIWIALAALTIAATAPAKPREITPGLFVYEDTCNVYAIVKDGRALLIDFGSGGILQHLDAMGVKQADWILHTHFHRDQNQGDHLAIARGIKIAVPAAERKYFEAAEEMWQEKKVLHLYDLRNEFFAPARNIPVDRGLEPRTVFEWQGIPLRVMSSPGHTEGSLSYLLDWNSKKYAFTGDLVASPGRILTMHDLESPYVGARGIAAQISSLNSMRQAAPDVLLPSHGEPTTGVQASIPPLIRDIAVIHDQYNWYNYTVRQPITGITQMSPHVWHVRIAGGGTAYVVVADSGRAFIWDSHVNDVPYIEEIQKKTGFRQVDFVTVSHYHDDHVGGVNEIKRRYGAKFWVMRHMVEILENPIAFNMPCLWHEPIKVDRILSDGESFDWEGMKLRFYYLPGQTEFAQGLLLEVDGKRILFDGDNISYPVPGRPMLGHYVARNYQRLDGGHIYCAKKFLEVKPDFIAPNHFEWVPATSEILQSYLKNSEEMKEVFTRVLDQPNPMFGLDNNWSSAFPYQVEAKPGQEIHLEVRFRNWLYAEAKVRAAWRVPEGWSVDPPVAEVSAFPYSGAKAAARLRIPQDAKPNRRYVLTLDVERDGKHLGEITEMLVNMAPMKAH
jgi:glyoxylase-like metal-dependent hydrolase (beta-lactamase superfamily II)